MEEIWKPIPQYEGYEASNMGRIRSGNFKIYNKGSHREYYSHGKVLHSCVGHGGYCVVNIHSRTQYVHRLVCMAFIGDIPKGMTVNHKDGIKTNNTIENLEIVTYSENHLHAFRVLHRRPTNLGVLNKGCSKAVCQYNNEGDLIKVYPSAREAERQIGVSYKLISSCCHQRRKTAGGYKWKLLHKI